MLRAKVQGVEEQLANFYTARADAEIAEKLEGASCPECNTSLTIYNGALCVADSAGHQHSAEDCTHRIQETQTKLAKGKKIEAAVDHLISGMDFQLLSQFEDIASIEFAIETLSRRCNEYKELNTQIIAHGMETKALNEKCSKKESEVQTLDKEIELALARINKNPLGPEVLSYAKLPQDEIVSQLATHKVRYQNAQNMATELEKERAFLENLTTQKTELSTKYKTLKGQLGDWDREACEAAMQNAEAEVQSVILRIMNHESQIENLTETVNEGAILQAKQEEIAVHLKRTRDQIAQHSANAQPIIQKHAAALKLKELSDAAQMKSIAFTLDALNLGAKEYLDLMFQDPPISVELKPFKENKDSSVRAKLSLSVSYRGMELDNITDDVSGGENDRIILAYQLAMNSMYNSPILLLDEPFTGLNQELIDVCLDSLKVLSQNKLILVVAHGINKGMFDDVIEV
jgi:DNA repair ATPase RecN